MLLMLVHVNFSYVDLVQVPLFGILLRSNVRGLIYGTQVSVSGYHHKLITLVEKIIDKVVNFEVEEERFLVIKVRVFPF